ncbi:MAG TPA: cytochrome c oxidase subunit 4 [Gaiellaceae bacterium]|nr:cytochrome c oxidase subunit 4 [Gaiellaceae bacterium]
MEEQGRHKPEVPGPSVWPIGVAIGIACVLVGLVISWWIVAIGGGITIVFGFLWLSELSGHPIARRPAAPPAPQTGPPPPARRPQGPATSRTGFLSLATLGLGGVIGALVSIPPVFVALIPPFLKQNKKPVDLGPISQFPMAQWIVTTFMLVPSEGAVSRRTAYIRYNGLLGKSPSFTIISNRCAHLGCPVQPLGLLTGTPKTISATGGESVTTQEVLAVSGFSCPCHGGAYDTEGNRTAGPPVRGLDRYEFSIVNGHLILGRNYSVGHVTGSGATAKIQAYNLTGPGQHVDGWEQIFYPIQPPH